MKIKSESGYNAKVAEKFLNIHGQFHILSHEPIPKFRFEDNKATDEVIGYSVSMVQEGIDESFEVKFSIAPDLSNLPFLSAVKLTALEGCEMGRNVYFRANKLVAEK